MQIRFQDLAWIDAPMPDGSGAVQLAQLPALDDQAFRAFVRFPAGWSRPSTGYYPVDEEVFVLDGDLTFNEHTWHAGSYGWIPAHSPRRTLRSQGGALVLAWFSGPPRWKRGASPTSTRDVMRSVASWNTIPMVESAGMPNAHVLRDTGLHRTWLTQRTPSIALRFPVEQLLIDDRTWTHTGPDESCAASVATLWRAIGRA